MAVRPPTDVFRPHLPFDPFTNVERGPWHPSISRHAEPPSAVLVLGEPTPTDLHPLIYSPSLARTLVVVATHAPPYIPRVPVATVRILRLGTPLGQDGGALRLVGLLERADRVVRRYRLIAAHSPRILVQYAENTATGEFDVEEEYSPAEPPSPNSPTGRPSHHLPRYPSPAPSASSSLSSSSSSSSSYSSTLSRRRRGSRVPTSSSKPPQDRAFDAIINFLPSSLPDKYLLKYAILVSTLTTSFISAPPVSLTPLPQPSSSSTAPTSKSKKRTSIFSTLSFSSSDAHITDDSQAESNTSRRFSSFLLRRPTESSSSHPSSSLFIHSSAPSSQLSLQSASASALKGKSRSHVHLSPTLRKAHLIHILPAHVFYPHNHHQNQNIISSGGSGYSNKFNSKLKPPQRQQAKPKLVQSIEQFLLAFGYPLQSMSLLPSAQSSRPSSVSSRRISAGSTISSSHFIPNTFGGMGVEGLGGLGMGGAETKPVPFLIPAGVFGSLPSSTGAGGGKILTIGEIILLGGLDRTGAGDNYARGGGGGGDGGSGDAGMMMMEEEGRVWIGNARDIVWKDDYEYEVADGQESYVNGQHTRSPSGSRQVAAIPLPSPVSTLAPTLAPTTTPQIQAPSPTHPRTHFHPPSSTSSPSSSSPWKSNTLPLPNVIPPPPPAAATNVAQHRHHHQHTRSSSNSGSPTSSPSSPTVKSRFMSRSKSAVASGSGSGSKSAPSSPIISSSPQQKQQQRLAVPVSPASPTSTTTTTATTTVVSKTQKPSIQTVTSSTGRSKSSPSSPISPSAVTARTSPPTVVKRVAPPPPPLPTPPESASSLEGREVSGEDGEGDEDEDDDDDDDDRDTCESGATGLTGMTGMTGMTGTTGITGVTTNGNVGVVMNPGSSLTVDDHHHHHYHYEKSKKRWSGWMGKPRAATSIGHGRVEDEHDYGLEGKNTNLKASSTIGHGRGRAGKIKKKMVNLKAASTPNVILESSTALKKVSEKKGFFAKTTNRFGFGMGRALFGGGGSAKKV